MTDIAVSSNFLSHLHFAIAAMWIFVPQDSKLADPPLDDRGCHLQYVSEEQAVSCSASLDRGGNGVFIIPYMMKEWGQRM